MLGLQRKVPNPSVGSWFQFLTAKHMCTHTATAKLVCDSFPNTVRPLTTVYGYYAIYSRELSAFSYSSSWVKSVE